MTEIRLHSKENPDGTFTYHAKCHLESVTDNFGNVVDNPVRTVVWNTIQNKYVLKEESNNDYDIDASLDDDFYDFANSNNDYYNNKDSFLGRECWCARIFIEPQPDFELDDVLRLTDEASFCPIDSNADGFTSRRDVRVCNAIAVMDRYGHIMSKDQQCYSELPVVEFAKSTWPLCFFWWILLVYMLCGTHYGSRVMGYLRRKMLLKCTGLKRLLWRRTPNASNGRGSVEAEEGVTPENSAATTTARQQRPSVNGEENNRDGEEDRNNNPGDNDDDEEQGGTGSTEPTTTTFGEENRTDPDLPAAPDSSNQRRRPDPPARRSPDPPALVPPPPPPPPPPGGMRSETNINNDDDRSSWSGNNLASIERDFGSLDNYLILDNQLRHQANNSNNEFVTWLWYSAVYTEVRRYRYERWLARRERERFRRLGDHTEEEEDDDDDDDDDAITGAGGLLGSRRLDSVFWWPPSGPDGSRWAHLRSSNNNTSNQSGTNEHGVPLDESRLCLKTKRFSLDSGEEEGKAPNNNNTPPTPVEEETKSGEHDFSEVSDNTCSICLCDLEEGDLVGDIPCGHLFHKDCLKEWLVKNNHCPVCRTPNIACHPVDNRPPSGRRRVPTPTENDRRAAYISALSNEGDVGESSIERTHAPRMFGW